MNRYRGITLIEVLVYLGIFTIVVQGLITSFYTLESLRSSLEADAHVHDAGLWLLEHIRDVFEHTHAVPKISDVRAELASDDVEIGNLTSTPHTFAQGEIASTSVQFDLLVRDSRGHVHAGTFYETLTPPL